MAETFNGFRLTKLYFRRCDVCEATRYVAEGMTAWKCPRCKGSFPHDIPEPSAPPHFVLLVNQAKVPKRKGLDNRPPA